MRLLSFGLTFLFIFLLGGCGSSKSGTQDAAGQSLTWKTKRIPANFVLSSNSFTGPVRIYYQLRAQCNSTNCKPTQAQLTFSRQSNTNTLYLSNRNLSIQAGKENYEWKGVERTNIYETQAVGGIIKNVTLEWDQFVQIATAHDVSGNLAGENFKWTYENRAPLRTLLSKIESNSANVD